jgi:peptidyl-prolyl cis-trans isomerase B (cyclophilin B)
MIRTTWHSRRRTVVAATLALFVGACGGGGTDPETAAPTTAAVPTTPALIPLQGPPTDYEGFRAQATACSAGVPEAAADLQFPAYEDEEVAVGTTATIATSCGEIVIELDPVAAPETTKSFVFLAKQGYFDGTAFHRVLPGFVIQGGDPTATGRGAPGYIVPDEFPADDFEYAFGVVAMANAGPGTTGSQFFIMVGEAGLPPSYNPFGRVVSGDEALLDIVRLPLAVTTRGERSIPLETVYIESVTITEP